MQELNNLDLTVLDALKKLRTERETIETRLSQMEARKHEVAPPIYLRVRSDYEQQKQNLQQEQAPLKAKAASIYAEVRAKLDQVERAHDEMALALQELDFRHSLGEFNAADYQGRADKLKASLTAQQLAREHAEALRARFVDAFENEAALELATPQTFVAPKPAVALTAPEPKAPVASPVMAPSAAAPPAATPRFAPPPLPDDDGQTAVMAPVPAPPVPAPAAKRNPDATMMFRPGKLIPVNIEAGSAQTMLSLKPINIGSDASSDVRLIAPGIAARHIEISLSRGGFVLKNLVGPGVLINGLEVSEQLLADGDQIQVGLAKFAFKVA